MTKNVKRPPMGWLPDYPDFRDYNVQSDQVKPVLEKLNILKSGEETLPESVDLSAWCSPVEHQEDLGSCSAHAGVGLMEYYERKVHGKHIDASRLFLYKTTRNLLHWEGDTGAFLRTTMAALVLFGVPPEDYWPYDIEYFDEEPPAFCYSFGQSFQATNYFRLDPPNTQTAEVLDQIKWFLANGLPAMFGFTVFSSIAEATETGRIPFPGNNEKNLGGHAVMAVGYDDRMIIKNKMSDVETQGALLIRNSWGEEWGDGGYGWLPYRFVLDGLAEDWWSLISSEWVNTTVFGL